MLAISDQFPYLSSMIYGHSRMLLVHISYVLDPLKMVMAILFRKCISFITILYE